jgi:hypothetical protein
MTNIKEMIKRTAQIGLLTGTLLYSGCSGDYELPIEGSSRSMEKNIVELRRSMNKQILDEQARKEREFHESEREFYEPRIKTYQEMLKGLDKLFTDSIRDGELTLSEQEKIYAEFERARRVKNRLVGNFQNELCGIKSKYGNIGNGTKGSTYVICRDSRLNFPDRYSNVIDLVDENLHCCDTGSPNLQNVLQKQGLPVTVESKFSTAEKFWTGVAALSFIGFLMKAFNGKD